MLLSVLNSERAVQINILIMRAFVRLRTLLFGASVDSMYASSAVSFCGTSSSPVANTRSHR